MGMPGLGGGISIGGGIGMPGFGMGGECLFNWRRAHRTTRNDGYYNGSMGLGNGY